MSTKIGKLHVIILIIAVMFASCTKERLENDSHNNQPIDKTTQKF